MRSGTITRTRGGLAAIAVAAALSSCAAERDPIDRVQPNALDKAIFTGEWYYGRTVVDVPASNGFTAVGRTDYAGLTKIRWDIEEKFLYARRTTELIENSDGKQQDVEGYEGEVVAAFEVEGHFDIINDYNPTTGEKLNIIKEDATDRPWYERAYMRVNWAENKVTNYHLDFEAASVESVPYYVQDKKTETGDKHPDAPHFAADGSYFDVTSRIFAKAGTTEIEGYGEIPLCWLRGEEFTECGAGEYSIRHSFLKRDPERQYEPLPYKGKATEVFGYFTADRMSYDGKEGIRQQAKKRYLTRHNLWKRWFDAEGEPIPYAERELRPIVYFVNRDFPEDLKDVARRTADQYNDVFTETVEALGHEPKGRTFILCANNPVIEGDPPECGAVGNSPRIGDVRYSFMAYVPKYMTYGLLGLGPSNNDQETGEIFSGMAYVYHHNNTAAYRTVEMLQLLNGQKDPKDYIDGVDLGEWVERVTGKKESAARTFGLDEAEHMVSRIAKGWRAAYWAKERKAPTPADEAAQRSQGFERWVAPHLEDIYRRGFANGEKRAAAGKLSQLKDTYIEHLLLDPEILLAGGAAPGMPVTDAHKRTASVARGGLGQLAKQRSRLREEFAASRNMYLLEMADDALVGLAFDLIGKQPDEVYELVRRTIYSAVLTHEVGHSVGLMHNFGGSDDALNYHDAYWEIRDDGKVGPRLTDPMTNNERSAKLYDNAYSSIMDYAGRYTIDGQGLGKYDRAAIIFGYAQKVEVYKNHGSVPVDELRSWHERDGEIVRFLNSGPKAVHYTSFYNRMGSKLYEKSNRELVDVSDLAEDFSTTSGEGGGAKKVRVPYIYCSHSRSNLGDSCLTRDYGADAYERMYNLLNEYNTWYIERSFPRGVIGRDYFNYVSRYYGRIYDRIKRFNDLYGLYADLLPRFYTPDQLQAFLTDPQTGWGDKTWAVQNGFNHLVQTILMPDAGGYGGPYNTGDGGKLMQKVGSAGSVNLGPADARYYSTAWGSASTRECGYFWWECIHHVGFYLDKVMAIEALSDSSTNFVARATPEDLRQWEISYYSTFPEQIAKINAAIMRRDYAKIGPYIENGQLKFPNYAGKLDESHARPVDPYATFSVQLYWQVLGQARFFNNFDQSFVDDSRLWIVGSGNQPDLPADRVYSFTDPISGISYAAIKFADHVGAGMAVLQRAMVMRGFTDYCDKDTSTPATEDDCQETDERSKAFITAELLDHLELIKIMADLHPLLHVPTPYS